MRRRKRAVRLAAGLYALSLLALPGVLREAARRDMMATFHRLARRWARAGWGRLLAGTTAETWDVVRSGVRARWRRLHRGPIVRTVADAQRVAADPHRGPYFPTPEAAAHDARARPPRRGGALAGVGSLALRRIVRRPSYSLTFVATLGVGLGSAAAMFSIVSAVALRPAAYVSPERIVHVWMEEVADGKEVIGIDVPTLLAWRGESSVLERIEAFHRSPDRVLTGDGPPEQLTAAYVTPGLFDFLGVQPVLGRGFLAEEGHVGSARTIVISHRLWSGRYARDPAIVGRSIDVNGAPFTVVGVMGRGFSFPEEADAWFPVAWASDVMTRVGVGDAVARLRPGTSLEAANERLKALATEDASLTPTGRRLNLVPPLSWVTPERTKLQLLVAFGAVLLVLLIALGNIVSLGLAGASARARELAIQAALGASRSRLVLQLVAEATALSACALLLGLLLAGGALRVILPIIEEVLTLNTGGRVPSVWPDGALFAGIAAAMAGPLVGLLIAAGAGVRRSSASLNTRSSTDEHRTVRLQQGLIVAEVALAFVLVAGAGLLVNSMVRLVAREPGFDADHLLTTTLQLPGERYPDAAARNAFFARVEEELRRLPGVAGVVATRTDFPRSGARFRPELATSAGASQSMQPGEARTTPESAAAMFLPEITAGAGFHELVGTPILRGRAFTAADAQAPFLIVNETMARRLWPRGDAVGQQLRLTQREDWLTVIGVAADAVQTGPRDDWGQGMEIYRLLDPAADRSTRSFVLRTRGSPEALLDRVRNAVWSVDPLQPVEVRTVRAALAQTLLRERFYLGLLSVFAALATFLAAIGLHAVLAQLVARRTREIGIRVALGARPLEVVRSAVGTMAGLVGVGLVLGVIAAVGLTRFLQSLLFGVQPHDPATLGVNVAILLATAITACLLPTRRALAIDPVRALGAE